MMRRRLGSSKEILLDIRASYTFPEPGVDLALCVLRVLLASAWDAEDQASIRALESFGVELRRLCDEHKIDCAVLASQISALKYCDDRFELVRRDMASVETAYATKMTSALDLLAIIS